MGASSSSRENEVAGRQHTSSSEGQPSLLRTTIAAAGRPRSVAAPPSIGAEEKMHTRYSRLHMYIQVKLGEVPV